MSDTPEIDYDKLATMVAEKLRARSIAYVQGMATLDDEWLADQFLRFVDYNSPYISRRITATNDFDDTFKLKRKNVINTIY